MSEDDQEYSGQQQYHQEYAEGNQSFGRKDYNPEGFQLAAAPKPDNFRAQSAKTQQFSKFSQPRRRPVTGIRKKSKHSVASFQQLDPKSEIEQARMAQEISKFRPRVVKQERERLYDDVIKHQMVNNNLLQENISLKTKLHFLSNEANKKDKIIEELMLLQQDIQTGNSLRNNSSLSINLKRKLRDVQAELQAKIDEVELLKRNIRNTRTNEQEVEIKAFSDECQRLRTTLEEVIKSKDTFADPQELQLIESKFKQRDEVIRAQKQELDSVTKQYNEMYERWEKLSRLSEQQQEKLRRQDYERRTAITTKRALKETEQEYMKCRKQCLDFQEQIRQMGCKGQQSDLVKKLQLELKNKQDELAQCQRDALKLQQNNLKESPLPVKTKTESPVKAIDKPKAAVTRPKDTVKREQSATAPRPERVTQEKLKDAKYQLKLKLQELGYDQKQIYKLLPKELTVTDLCKQFESLGVKQAMLLARYVAEKDNLTKQTAVESLSSLIGNYQLFANIEKQMNQKVVEAFLNQKSSLNNALASEDYEDSGLIDVTQAREAIVSMQEDVDEQTLDYMLWHMYRDSKDFERMNYDRIVQLLDEAPKPGASSKVKPEEPKPKQSEHDDYSEDYDNDLNDIRNLLPQRKDSQDYEESPRPKESAYGEPETNEDQMIDVAEQMFIKIADALLKNNIGIREVWQQHLFAAEIEGDEYEMLSEQGFVEGIQYLEIPDVQDFDVQCLLKVLSKPELDGNILLQEFLQIMENFGLYDKPAVAQLDLGQLDQKSVKIMVMLMLYLIENNLSTVEFFKAAIVQQDGVDLIQASDFFKVLQEQGVRKKQTPHANLEEFLKMGGSELLAVQTIRQTLEQMAANEEFMNAIRQDILTAQE